VKLHKMYYFLGSAWDVDASSANLSESAVIEALGFMQNILKTKPKILISFFIGFQVPSLF
jgi:hypothetical protein